MVITLVATLIYAQTGTAATPIAPSGIVPCHAPVRSYDNLQTLLATPVAEPTAAETAQTIPAGMPADAETISGVTATIHELIACFNAGEVLRAYSLYTDDYLREIFSNQDPLTQAAYDLRSTPHPGDRDEEATLREIRGARIFADDSAGAYVTIDYPLIPVPKTFFFRFVLLDGRWLIDGAVGEISFSVP